MPTFSNYPQSARSAARRALKFKEKNGTSCGTPVGWQRANQIASGEALSLETVKRTYSFLSRAGVYNQGKFTDSDGKPICGSIMYAAWGGSSMLPWCKRIIAEAERSNIEDKEDRHIMAVQETDESIYITLQKAPGFGGIQQKPSSGNVTPDSNPADDGGGGGGGGVDGGDAPSRPSGDGGITGGDGKSQNDMEEEKRHTEIERRSFVPSSDELEVRMDDEGRTVEGYAAVFNQPTMIGAVEEVVSPGAFDDRLMDDVVALFNHDMNMPLARSFNGQGTLELKVDEHGLYYKFNLGNQSYAKDLAESIKRGDVRGSSFGFVVREDDYEKKEDGTYRRTIKRLARIADVSPVVSPAYPQTSVKMRDAIAALEAENEVVEETPVQDEIQPTSAPKRKVAEALLSIHHHKTLSK